MVNKEQETYTLRRLTSLCEKFIEERLFHALVNKPSTQFIDTSARTFITWLRLQERKPVLLERARQERDKQKKEKQEREEKLKKMDEEATKVLETQKKAEVRPFKA